MVYFIEIGNYTILFNDTMLRVACYGLAGERVSRTAQPATHNPQPATRNPQPATRNPQPATRNPKRCVLPTLLILVLSFCTFESTAQDEPMMVGFQYRPIFHNSLFKSGNTDIEQNNVSFTIRQKLGYSYGMVVRTPLGKKLTLEGGINYIKRNYSFGVEDLDSTFNASANFAIVEYEIPFAALIHIRVSDDFYLNSSAGLSINIFKRSEVEYVDNIAYGFGRRSWMNMALIANVGAEYRTENSGYFYIGSSYQLPFSKIIVMTGEYFRNNSSEEITTDMNLGFFTLDLKYYLPSREQ